MSSSCANLALFRRFIDRSRRAWPEFAGRRNNRLIQAVRNDGAAEKVAENILEDFFTTALDWELGDINNQIQFADMVLTKNGIKRLVVELKRPSSLTWHQHSLEPALEQARRYAAVQRVKSVAVSDGTLFYAADIVHGGLEPRARLQLDSHLLPLDSWWVSVDGICREPEMLEDADASSLPVEVSVQPPSPVKDPCLLHPKYEIPAYCFAYVGDATDVRTWKLPCWHSTGEVDTGRLPGAIRAILMSYRGARVLIPEAAVPDVLVRLGKAAAAAKKLPGQDPNPGQSYQQLHDALEQIDRLSEILPQE